MCVCVCVCGCGCVTLNSYHIVFRSLEDAAPGESFTEDGPITYEVLLFKKCQLLEIY